ncbi:hypothetical protein EPN42_02990 [bacterium]|nr:MAG: hypothetical protein EPN42_02990 [bacterium]
MSVFALARTGIPVIAFAAVAALAACGGGSGGGGGGGTAYTPPSNNPPATNPPVSTQQVVSMALPQSTIGQETDPTWGLVGGFTQTTGSQVLAFAPGSQVMLKNLASSTQHTLNVIASGVMPGMAFPSVTLSTSAAGGSTIGSGFASGALNGGQLAGPFTLAQGTYYVGCAFHYLTNTMRDVLIVQANATPGPQATPPPSGSGNPCPGGYC